MVFILFYLNAVAMMSFPSLFLLASFAPGLSSGPDSTVFLETTVVTASRTEQRLENTTVSVDVLPLRVLEEKANARVEQVIQMSPGVTLQDGQANIRSGSGWSLGAGSRVLILVDDLPALSPDAGGVLWNAMPMEAVQQVEVLKGASSSLYGSSALNGVIHLRTWEPSAQQRVRVSTLVEAYDKPKMRSLGWWDQPRGRAAVRYAFSDSYGKKNQHGIVLHGQLFGDQGYQYLVGDQSARMHAKYRYKPSNQLEIGLQGQYWTSDRSSSLIWEDYRLGYTPLDSSATQTQSDLAALTGHVKYRQGRQLHTVRLRGMSYANASGLDSNDYSNAGTSVHAEYLWQLFSSEGWTLSAGALYLRSAMNSPLFSGAHLGVNQAVFAQADKTADRWDASMGLRWESFSVDGTADAKPVLRLGGHYELAESSHLRASWAQGYRFPSIAERFSASAAGALQVFPSPGIQSESGWTAELGYKQGFRLKGLQGYLDAAFFYTQFNHMLEFTFGKWGNLPGTTLANYGFTSLNVGPTRITGLELTGGARGFVGPVKVEGMAGYTYSLPVALDPTGVYATDVDGQALSYQSTSLDPSQNFLKYRYVHNAKADVQASWKGWTLGGSVRYNSFMSNIDAIFTDPLIAIFVPGVADSRYQLNKGDFFVDFRLNTRLTDHLTVQTGILNVLNRLASPRPALLAEPRTFTLQLSYALN